ncbi:MAG TPA: UbiX family flavin prenyltransferase [Candidatus Poseidoniales archaeon]|nr:UbiX family flavin prenyltransferase [Candidatus Poseidoniales archaeon]
MTSVVLVISGASGAAYGVRLLEALCELGAEVRLVVTDSGRLTLQHECSTTPEDLANKFDVILDANDDVAARSASGSARIDHVVICPASGTTIGKIASGIGDNLATRSAIVALKERRKLILIPREAPFATVHLEQMTRLSTHGAVILPASPGFYNHPDTIDDLIDFIVARILDQMNLEHTLGRRWTGKEIGEA